MIAPAVYDSPSYYDIAYGWDPIGEVTLYLGCFRAFGAFREPKSLYEPGSGSGRLAVAFAKRGIFVTGLDRSFEMNRYVEERAQREGVGTLARVETGRMEEVPPGPAAEGAYCALSTFRYLTDDAGIVSHLRTLGARLRPGATYVLDTRFSEGVPRTPLREFWENARDGIRILARWEMEIGRSAPAVGTETLTLEIEEGGRRFVLVERNPTRLDSRESFERLVESSGCFEVAGYLGPERDPARPIPSKRVQGRAVAILRRKERI